MHWTRVLWCVCAAFALTTTGCSQQKDEITYTPQPFGEHDRCLLCGMVITHYAGPKAQVFIKDLGQEAVKFCSGRDAFTFALQPENARRLQAFFIHDLAKTEWDTPDDRFLMDARQAHYVYGHDVEGVMGNEPAAFSSLDAAKAFVEKHGGKIYDYGSVTLELLDQ